MWRDLIESHWSGCDVGGSSTDAQLEQCEDELSIALPESLIGFYRDCDGLSSPSGECIIYSIDDLISTNVDLWLNDEYIELFMPLECLLFIGNSGREMYGFAVLGDRAKNDRIYRWNRTSDNRTLFASSFEQYLYKRWKALKEDDVNFWDHAGDCKNFDDYRQFLRACSGG